MKHQEKTRDQLATEQVAAFKASETTPDQLGTQERVLQKVRHEIWQMQTSQDIKQILLAVRDGLHALGVTFRSCGVSLIDERLDPTTVTIHNIYDQEYLTTKPAASKESAVIENLTKRQQEAIDKAKKPFEKKVEIFGSILEEVESGN